MKGEKTMRVLVTGSSGLIGRWVCNRLGNEGCAPFGLDRQERQEDQGWLPFERCDIMNEPELRKAFENIKPHAVVHLAARIDLDEKKDLAKYAANIDGVRNVLNCIRETESVRRVIVTSSQLVCRVGYVPKSETDYCPNTLYGESKVLTEKTTREMDGGGKEWCIVRPTTVWGPYMSEHYRGLLRLIRRGRYFHCGNSLLYKSYSFAGNIAYQYWKLLIASVDAIYGKTFYLADYEPLSLRAYTDALAKEMGAPRIPTVPLPVARFLACGGDVLNRLGWAAFPFNSFRLRNILTEYKFDLSPTKAVCGDLPYGFDDGVSTTARWFLEKDGR